MKSNRTKEHKAKLKLARQRMTPNEIKSGVSPFASKWWTIRKEQRLDNLIVESDLADRARQRKKKENIANHKKGKNE